MQKYNFFGGICRTLLQNSLVHVKIGFIWRNLQNSLLYGHTFWRSVPEWAGYGCLWSVSSVQISLVWNAYGMSLLWECIWSVSFVEREETLHPQKRNVCCAMYVGCLLCGMHMGCLFCGKQKKHSIRHKFRRREMCAVQYISKVIFLCISNSGLYIESDVLKVTFFCMSNSAMYIESDISLYIERGIYPRVDIFHCISNVMYMECDVH